MRKSEHILQLKLLKDELNRIKNSAVGKRFFKGLLWNATGVIASRILWLIATFFLARMLSIEKFGELGIIQSTISMFGVFTGLGLGLTATKYLAELKLKDPPKAGRIISLTQIIVLVTSLIFGLALFIAADWLSKNTLASPGLGFYLKISSLLLVFNSLNGVQIGILTGLENFKLIARANFINGILSIILALVGAYLFGLEGVIWGLVISISITFFMIQYALKIEFAKYKIKYDFKSCLKESEILWKFSMPALLSGALVMPVNWICNALLVNQDAGYKEMGILNAANQWYAVMVFLPNIVAGTILPILTENISINEKEKSKKLLRYSIYLNFFSLLPIITAGIILSNIIMNLYGIEFRGQGSVLVFTFLAALMYAIQIPVGNYIAATGRMWIGLIINLVWGIIFIFSTIQIVELGAEGLSISRLIAYLVMALLTYFYVFRKINDVKDDTSF